MPNDERKRAKIISFAKNFSRPFSRPLDSASLAAFAEARRHVRNMVACILPEHLPEFVAGKSTYEVKFKALKTRDSSHMHHLFGEYERSCAFCQNEVNSERLKRPTTWDHLLKDEGL